MRKPRSSRIEGRTPASARQTTRYSLRGQKPCNTERRSKQKSVQRKGCLCQSGTGLLQVGVGTIWSQVEAASRGRVPRLRNCRRVPSRQECLPHVSPSLSGWTLVMIDVCQDANSVKRRLAWKDAGSSHPLCHVESLLPHLATIRQCCPSLVWSCSFLRGPSLSSGKF